MSEPYIGDIRMFAGTFAPVGYLPCDGRSLTIADYTTLYALIGTTYGGDGQTNFLLPDLRGRVPLHFGNNIALGMTSGAETATVSTPQLPPHTHTFAASGATGTATTPAGNVFAVAPSAMYLQDAAGGNAMSGATGSFTGNSEPHPNIQPYLCINFIIATDGSFPPRPQ